MDTETETDRKSTIRPRPKHDKEHMNRKVRRRHEPSSDHDRSTRKPSATAPEKGSGDTPGGDHRQAVGRHRHEVAIADSEQLVRSYNVATPVAVSVPRSAGVERKHRSRGHKSSAPPPQGPSRLEKPSVAHRVVAGESTFIQVKPKPKEEPTEVEEGSNLPDSETEAQNANERTVKPCVIIVPVAPEQTDEVKPFPRMYPDYRVEFNCRLAVKQSKSSLKTENAAGGSISKIGEQVTKRDGMELEDGEGVAPNRPEFILDTSVTPFVVRRCSPREALAVSSFDYNLSAAPEKLRQVSRIQDLSPQSFVVTRIDLEPTPTVGKPPFKLRDAWKTPPGSPREAKRAAKAKSKDEIQKHENGGSAQVMAAGGGDTGELELGIASTPTPEAQTTIVPRGYQGSDEESDPDDNWDVDKNGTGDTASGSTCTAVKAIDAKTSPAPAVSNGTADTGQDDVYCEVKDAEEVRKLFTYPNVLELTITQPITDSPSPNYYTIGQIDEGLPKFIVNKNRVSENLPEFVMLPAPIGFLIQCTIRRDNKGVERGLFPTYYLHLEYEDGKKVFLLSARKRKKSATSNYLICTDPIQLTKETMVGKLRSNLLGTQFNIFDSGKAPRSKFFLERNDEEYREELGVVSYEHNIFGFRGPRKLQVYIPSMFNDHQRLVHRPIHDSDSLVGKFKSELGAVLRLKNRSPTWHENNQSWVLNFHGRVNAASVKNFQLVHEDREDYTILQFGRAGPDELFTLDFRYPLCPLQAFALALTSFDNKLACE